MGILWNKLFVFCSFSFISFFCFVSSVEEVVFLHAPESVKFLSSEPIHSSYIGDILSSLLAYSIRSNVEWHSLAAVTPWKRPEAIVVLEILGFDNKIDLPLSGTRFLLENVGDLENQFDLPAHRTDERYFGKNPVMLHMDVGAELYESKIVQPVLLKAIPADPKQRLQLALSDPELGGLIQNSVFNLSIPSDSKILTELATLKEFLKALSSHKSEIHNNIPDIYWLKVSGLDSLASIYSPKSLQFREALRLLRQMVAEVERTMRNVYDDNVVITVIKASGTPLPLGHRGRRLLESIEAAPTAVNLNLATRWDPMFPVTFIIMLFVGIVLALSVFGISLAIWNMDPGRDSIIYRMTSQRMKRD